ncbi:hypothetical protein ODZ84_15565 [Chryseobacterium fluminis]|uniref:hypothetical protein n=1 Tax=Chryseobacterium fluminis TaxID=2983606 RepID=UPI00224E69D3|nr:hypothetical protein [Chryseobacterium sp. MMS21-Ot14]UZT96633.1 hypothetical protein ODZ84_15565 [Chryseobacterium sp. MMS21-Ot14]
MKKLLAAMYLALGLGFATAQQTVPATAAKTQQTTKTTKTAATTNPASPTVKMKKDGTPDKRYKDNKNLKKDGTPDRRYKANK